MELIQNILVPSMVKSSICSVVSISCMVVSSVVILEDFSLSAACGVSFVAEVGGSVGRPYRPAQPLRQSTTANSRTSGIWR